MCLVKTPSLWRIEHHFHQLLEANTLWPLWPDMLSTGVRLLSATSLTDTDLDSQPSLCRATHRRGPPIHYCCQANKAGGVLAFGPRLGQKSTIIACSTLLTTPLQRAAPLRSAIYTNTAAADGPASKWGTLEMHPSHTSAAICAPHPLLLLLHTRL
jgi:hypothetical protein